MSETRIERSRNVFARKEDEQILVVPRPKLFPCGAFNGLRELESEHEAVVRDHGMFMWRSKAETDPAYKQIIPYLVFTHNDRYFVMQRAASASEVRLQNKYSLGIGGHIRKEDITDLNIASWATREFHEEVTYSGKLAVEKFGLLNDDRDFVGQVHVGFVFLLHGDSDSISVKSELKSGRLMSLNEASAHHDSMESWSQYVFDALRKRV